MWNKLSIWELRTWSWPISRYCSGIACRYWQNDDKLLRWSVIRPRSEPSTSQIQFYTNLLDQDDYTNCSTSRTQNTREVRSVHITWCQMEPCALNANSDCSTKPGFITLRCIFSHCSVLGTVGDAENPPQITSLHWSTFLRWLSEKLFSFHTRNLCNSTVDFLDSVPKVLLLMLLLLLLISSSSKWLLI